MNSEAKDRLNQLLKTDPNALTGADIEFLKARNSYLTDEQKEVLDNLPDQLEAANKVKNDDADKVNTAQSAADVTDAFTNDEEDADSPPAKDVVSDYAAMKKADLQNELRNRGIEFDEGAKKDELIALINERVTNANNNE